MDNIAKPYKLAPKNARAGSEHPDHPVSNLIDGDVSKENFFATADGSMPSEAWISIELEKTKLVWRIIFVNGDDAEGKKLLNINVHVGDQEISKTSSANNTENKGLEPNNEMCGSYTGKPPISKGDVLIMDCKEDVTGKYVKITKDGVRSGLNIKEIELFGTGSVQFDFCIHSFMNV